MSNRMVRLEQQFQQEIALIIQREIKHPGLGFITVMSVALSKDLSHAKVAYSCLGSAEDRERSQEALDRSAGFIRELLKRRLRLKTIPELSFRYDASIETSIAMSDFLDRLKDKE